MRHLRRGRKRGLGLPLTMDLTNDDLLLWWWRVIGLVLYVVEFCLCLRANPSPRHFKRLSQILALVTILGSIAYIAAEVT